MPSPKDRRDGTPRLPIPPLWQNLPSVICSCWTFPLHRRRHHGRKKKWDKKSFTGVELGGKTLGLIGYGNIVIRTATLAIALGYEGPGV